jgi:threonylcarbamoyladenosine tRNA methylthiotransferase MtaB
MIPDLLESWYGSPGAFLEKRTDVGPNRDWDDLSLDRPRLLTRAFIKVQDGCGRSCSYCAVPSLRGGPVSRDPGGVMEEISRVAASGVKEVILTGTQIGSYGHGGVTLAGLVRRISEAGEVSRLRLGSIEPFSVDGDFLKAAAESEIFCRHLHLPLQSGDDGVLSSMRRGYGSADFARVARMARDYLGDGLHISTDLIVGFPGESEAAFSRSLELLEELEIGRVHVFPHSRRRGTEASSMKEILGETVRERMERALRAAGRLIASYAAKRVGEDDVMLAEEIDKGVVSGWSTKYIRVCARNGGTENCLKGNELAVRPKISIGSILLCEGVGREQIVNYPDE